MPKLWEALVTMLILVGALALGIVKYETDPHVPMFIGVMGAALMALYLGYKWEAIEKSMMDGIYKALQSVCISSSSVSSSAFGSTPVSFPQ